ncbi:MAG TPA: PEP-utilizing enzyme [Dehalococcoidia bacterium]|nr:PEP-utilizing enzyme [Dehalococcoidia bacterium]
MPSQDGLVSIYECSDGRDFPVRWRSAEEAGSTWHWDPEHNPAPVTPLDEAIWRECGSGSRRARSELGFAEGDVFVGGSSFAYFNGFNYWHESEPDEEARARAAEVNRRLREQYGSAANFWLQYCMPRAIRAVQQLLASTGDEPVASLIDTFGYGFEQTFLMWGIDEDHPVRFLREELGDEAERVAVELTKGYPTATLQAAQILWELAQDARASPPLAALFARGTPTLEEVEAVEGGGAFAEGFRRYLDYYGWRTTDWDPSSPTLREQPEISLQVVRRTIVEDLPEPASLVAAAADEREAAIEVLEQRFRSDAAKLSEFRARLLTLSGYLGLKEGRAQWQLSLCGAIRHALLARGRRLVEAGGLEAADDVFYLLPEEIEAAVAGRSGWGSVVAGRRAARLRWLGVVPPATIGGEAPAEAEKAAAPGELRGIGASRGVVTAPARVLASFDEYERLQPGEVLVCATTTPAWTPLFAVAGAIVADGGGLLSHTAIAAREYGIPAVVGVRGATTTIRDGQTVTVDGSAGVVRLGG